MKACLTMLDAHEAEQIHGYTLELLEKTGVSIMSDEVVEHLAKRGAKIAGNTVRFPREMVEEALGMLNHEILYAAVDDRYSFTFPHGTTTFNATSGYGAFYYPEPGAKRRPSTADDLALMATLAEALDDIDYFWPIVTPTEERCTPVQEIMSVNIAARHTGKHLECSCSSPEAARWQVRIVEALAGGSAALRKRPILSLIASPTTPLGFEKDTVEAIAILAQAGVPINPMDVPIAASTTPATYAGTLIVANAEQLATLVIAKSYAEDAPVVYSCDACAADMATGNLSYIDPAIDYDMLSIAGSDIARHYGYPSCVAHGCNERREITSVDTLMNNVQRIAITQMMRSDLSDWIGGKDNSIATSIWDIMLDIEALKYAKAYCRTHVIDDDTAALDVIDEVGPHGEFMSSEHTLDHYREELLVNGPASSYLFVDDGRDYIHKAYDRGLEVLAQVTPHTLDEALITELDDIVSAARSELE